MAKYGKYESFVDYLRDTNVSSKERLRAGIATMPLDSVQYRSAMKGSGMMDEEEAEKCLEEMASFYEQVPKIVKALCKAIYKKDLENKVKNKDQ